MSYYCTGDGDFKTNNLTKLIENFNKTYNTTGNEIPEKAILNDGIEIIDVYKDEKNPEKAEKFNKIPDRYLKLSVFYIKH